MIKKCKQCGSELASGESNKLCANCRNAKKNKRAVVNAERKKKKIL